jgi:hypothetical protein
MTYQVPDFAGRTEHITEFAVAYLRAKLKAPEGWHILNDPERRKKEIREAVAVARDIWDESMRLAYEGG